MLVMVGAVCVCVELASKRGVVVSRLKELQENTEPIVKVFENEDVLAKIQTARCVMCLC